MASYADLLLHMVLLLRNKFFHMRRFLEIISVSLYHFRFQAGFNRDRETGLSTMDHKTLSRHELTIEGNFVSMIAVELNCDNKVTPWCDN